MFPRPHVSISRAQVPGFGDITSTPGIPGLARSFPYAPSPGGVPANPLEVEIRRKRSANLELSHVPNVSLSLPLSLGSPRRLKPQVRLELYLELGDVVQ